MGDSVPYSCDPGERVRKLPLDDAVICEQPESRGMGPGHAPALVRREMLGDVDRCLNRHEQRQ